MLRTCLRRTVTSIMLGETKESSTMSSNDADYVVLLKKTHRLENRLFWTPSLLRRIYAKQTKGLCRQP